MWIARTTIVLFFATLSAAVTVMGKTAEQLDTIDGVKRQWRIFIPPSYQEGTPTPLVLDFHGTGSTAHGEAKLSEFGTLAADEAFIVVWPEAKYRRKKDGQVTWNVDLHQDTINDVKFVRELIATISEQYSVDPKRIYATGMSGGGRMSSRLACDLSDVVAAIGPVAGIQYPENCSPGRPVPIIAFHGKADNINHYIHQADSPDYWHMGVEKAIAEWVKNNQCFDSPLAQTVSETVTRVSYQACAGGGDIVFYRSENAGHTWPGSPRAVFFEEIGLGKTNTEVPATKLIWEFFKKHSLQ